MVEALGVNISNLTKIDAYFNSDAYKELIENSETFNTRLSIERKLRMPFLDFSTGIAQNHSSLFMSKRQRLPPYKPGQIYSYPAARWRKARRQYLTNPRPFGKLRETEYEEHLENSSSLGATLDNDSKDSHGKDQDVTSEWFYDEHDMDGFDEPDPHSDDDYEEPYHFKRQRRRGQRGGRGSRSDYTPRARGRGNRAPRASGGRNKANQSPSLDGGTDSPTSSRNNSRSRSSAASSNNIEKSSSSSSSTSLATLSAPTTNNLPQLTPHQTTSASGSTTTYFPPAIDDISQMPVLLPEQKPPEDPDETLLPPAHYIRKPMEKGRAPPSPYCDFCLGDAKENKKTNQAEDLVSCSDCGRSGHPTCLQFTANMKISVKKYRWQCIECKYCTICGTSDNDDQLLFCDDCDRGYHMYCLLPALEQPPEGSWSCKLCTEEFHTGKIPQ